MLFLPLSLYEIMAPTRRDLEHLHTPSFPSRTLNLSILNRLGGSFALRTIV